MEQKSNTFLFSEVMALQKRFYFEGPITEAWSSTQETFFWSNNLFLANHYAALIKPILKAKSSEGVTIVEMGAGQGRFGYLLITALYETMREQELNFRYIMTDISPKRLKFWKSHPKMQRYIQEGIVSFALLDMDRPQTARLDSGESLHSQLEKQNTVLISNYTLSDLEADIYTLRDHELYRTLLDFETDIAAVPSEDFLATLKETPYTFAYEKMEEPYVENPVFEAILKHYVATMEEGTFLLSKGLMATFEYFSTLGSSFYWLITDEADSELDAFVNQQPKLEQIETGLFSNKVNLHALNFYAGHLGFSVYSSETVNEWFDTYALLPNDSTLLNELDGVLKGFNTSDYLELYRAMLMRDAIAYNEILAFITLSGYDAEVVYRFRDLLLDIASDGTPLQKKRLLTSLRRAWENYFDIDESTDVAYYFGRIFRRLDAYEDAAGCFWHSIEKYGDYPVGYYYLGLCSQGLKQYADAVSYFEVALELKPDYTQAKRRLERNRAKIAAS